MDYFLFQQLFFSSYAEAFVKLRQQHFTDFQLTGLFQMAFDSEMRKVRQWVKIRMNKIEGTNISPSRITQKYESLYKEV